MRARRSAKRVRVRSCDLRWRWEKGWKAKNERCGVKAERRCYTGGEDRRRPSSPSVHTKRSGPTRNEGAAMRNESIQYTRRGMAQLKGGPKGVRGGGERTEGEGRTEEKARTAASTLSDSSAQHRTAPHRTALLGHAATLLRSRDTPRDRENQGVKR